MNKKVAILLSTYNGERYLKEQLESLFSQVNVDVTIFVRDDCSTDSTRNILENYKESLIILDNKHTNLGVGNSFMSILYEVGGKFDYYAFCDQDDVWQSNKLSKAIEMISEIDSPVLYCSNQQLVNKNLENIGLRNTEVPNVSYKQILTNNQLTGCTMVWNTELHRILIDEQRRPSSELLKVRIHDVWVGMVASIVGQIIYDPNAYIYYRQHDNNVVGVRKTSKKDLLRVWCNKFMDQTRRNGRSLLAQEIITKYRDIVSPDIISNLEIIALYRQSFIKKITLLRRSDLFSLSKESRFAIKLKILFNCI